MSVLEEAREGAWFDALRVTVTRAEAGHKALEARAAGYSWDFIAKALGVSEATVRKWAHAAKGES